MARAEADVGGVKADCYCYCCFCYRCLLFGVCCLLFAVVVVVAVGVCRLPCVVCCVLTVV